GWLSAIGIAPDLVIPHSPQLPPKRSEVISRFAQSPPEWRREGKLRNVSALRSFPLCASFSRSEYYDRTDAYDRHRGILPCALCRKPPTFYNTDSTRQLGLRLTRRQPTPSKDGLRLIAHLEWAMELPILKSFAHSIFAHRGAFKNQMPRF